MKAVWITGASSGIGKALSQEFIKKGKTVIGSSRNFEALNSLKNSLSSNAEFFIPVKLDVSNKQEVIECYSNLRDKFEIETLINNAGITSFKKSVDNSIEDVEAIVQTNLLGSVYAIKTVLPAMIERNSGKIINILSVVAKKIFLNSSAYSASKSGLLAYTNVLREEVRENNIRIINVLPGATVTNIWSEKVIEKYSMRMMKAEEIAKMIYELHDKDGNLVPEEIVLKPILGDL